MQSRRVTLIQCTKSKREEQAKARDLYDESDYFVKMREYAKARGVTWGILSAKYGLVYPDREIKPYDEFGLSEEQAREIADHLEETDVTEVEIVAGRKYTNPLIPELEKRGIDVINNFSGQMIGVRKSNLLTEAKRLRNENIC